MRVPTVTIQTKHSTGKHAVFIHWSGESNTGGSRVTDWTTPSAANVLAATIRGALADAYHAGFAEGVADANGDDQDNGPELWADLP
jgi:hypothetical protein